MAAQCGNSVAAFALLTNSNVDIDSLSAMIAVSSSSSSSSSSSTTTSTTTATTGGWTALHLCVDRSMSFDRLVSFGSAFSAQCGCDWRRRSRRIGSIVVLLFLVVAHICAVVDARRNAIDFGVRRARSLAHCRCTVCRRPLLSSTSSIDRRRCGARTWSRRRCGRLCGA